MRLPSLLALRAFEAAARCGGFTAAGRELNLTPSAISHQIRALETHFAKRLFSRRGIRVVPTADGARLAGELTAAFAIIDKACTAFGDRAPGGTLAVHCAPSFASKFLGPRLPDFMRIHPSVTLHLSSGAAQVDLTMHDELDLVISYSAALRRPGLVVESFGPEDIIAICTPAIAAQCDASSAAIGRLLILSSINPVSWSDWFALNDLPNPAPARRPSFDRGALAVSAAVQGLGIALESRSFALDELARGELVVLGQGRYRAVRREMHFLSYREGQRGSSPIVAFRMWLRQQGQGALPPGPPLGP